MAMTTTADKKGQPAAGEQKALARQDPVQQLAAIIASRKDAFALVAGKHFNPDRLIKLAHGALSRTPKLAECTPASLLVALMRCAELELEPDGALPQKRMWLVPRWNGKLNAMECSYLMDYRALIQKARETGLVKSIILSEVRAGDRFELFYDADGASITKFEFEPGGEGGPFSDRGEVIGYFAAARLEGGEVQIALLSKRKAEEFRDRYGPRNKSRELTGPWVGSEDQFDEMALKTCVRKLWKVLPAGKSEEARRLQAHVADETAIEEAGKSVQSMASVELDLALPSTEDETTGAAVERALAGAGSDEPPDDAKALDPGVDPQSMSTPKKGTAKAAIANGRPTAKAPPAKPEGMAERIAALRAEIIDRVGAEHATTAWMEACRKCADNRPSTQWTDSEIQQVALFLSTWSSGETPPPPAERVPGEDDGDGESAT